MRADGLGDVVVEVATELEGRVVVGKDADLTGAGSLNVGTAGGGGSAITPAGGTDMLVVGGDLATARNTQVGFHASRGGNVVVGAVSDTSSTNGYLSYILLQGNCGTPLISM